MLKTAGAMLAALALVGCGGQQATSSASPTTSAVSTSPSPSVSTSPSPSGSPVASLPDPKLTCATLPVPHDPLLLMRGKAAGLVVMDLADPLHPARLCQLLNANSGRFVSATKIVFWYSTFVGTADLETGSLIWNRAWVNEPLEVAFSPDGSNWAYREGDATGLRTHLVVGGKDTVLVTRAPLGGHGGPPFGPVDQLAFSATGQYLLTYEFFVSASDPTKFMVFAIDGTTAFKSNTAKFGTWDRTGNRLYFLAGTTTSGVVGTVKSLDPGGQPVVRSARLSSYFWPQLSPDGKTLVFNIFSAQGFPHPWRLDTASRVRAQASSATSSQPVFISPDYIWSTEGVPCQCGGGTSAPDGRVIAHNLRTGVNSVVLGVADLSATIAPTEDIEDVWFG